MPRFFIYSVELLPLYGCAVLIQSDEFDIVADLINHNLICYFDEVKVLAWRFDPIMLIKFSALFTFIILVFCFMF